MSSGYQIRTITALVIIASAIMSVDCAELRSSNEQTALGIGVKIDERRDVLDCPEVGFNNERWPSRSDGSPNDMPHWNCDIQRDSPNHCTVITMTVAGQAPDLKIQTRRLGPMTVEMEYETRVPFYIVANDGYQKLIVETGGLVLKPEQIIPPGSGKLMVRAGGSVVEVAPQDVAATLETMPPSRPPEPGDTWLNSVGMKLAYVPPGVFLMGSPEDEKLRVNNEQPHRVHLTKGFWLGVTEVTRKQYQLVMGEGLDRFGEYQGYPMKGVSWFDAVAYCVKLSEKEGRRYRLPTEAEWEYACRAGSTTPFHFGLTITTDQANYDGTYYYDRGPRGEFRKRTTPVRKFPPNAWGFYDMHGNVIEWCADWHGPYPPGEVTDPVGPADGKYRVMRGGAWRHPPWICRSAHRAFAMPDDKDLRHGFRVVLEPIQ